MLDLEAIELIKQLKARYFRFLDTGNTEGLKTVFTADASVHYRSPTYDHQKNGWPEIEAFIKQSFTKTKFGIHNGVHPEITVTGDTATGIWYLHDTFVSLDDGVQIQGSALYEDQYVKINGEWKIKHSQYDRLFEQITKRNGDMFITSCPIKS